jgi:hypothetical protein
MAIATRVLPVLALLAVGIGCGQARAPSEQEAPLAASSPEAPPPPLEEGAVGAKREAKAGRARNDKPSPSPAVGGMPGKAAAADGKDVAEAPEEEPAAERTRAWFPEAFLWQPLVETGPDGTATVPFTVPDSLTTWRVLALAHDRAGQQTGAVTTFSSTLPVYVEPVVPGWLYAGDRLVLPVQVMNNTSAPVSGALTVEATGPLSGLGTASVTLGAGSSDVRALPLTATGAGEARLTARFRAGDHADAAERVVPVLPTGRPVVATAGGTLTDERPFRVPVAEGADPSTQELEVVLFGGPLAVVQAELGRLSAGARPLDPAYGFALAARAVSLGEASGAPVSPDVVRRVRLLAWQRVVRDARAADPGVAADLLASLRGELGVEAAGPMRTTLVRALVDGQRADGTWGRRPTAPLQEVLVNTAWAGRVLPEDQRAARLRASAALERFLHEVKDPYTAAVVLASGLVDGDAASALRATLTDAVRRADDGTPSIDVPAGVVNPWGVRPAASEVAAFAVLALPDGPERRDLAATLLSAWSAADGFGAGRVDCLALEAVALALPPTTSPVTVSVSADGEVVASGRWDPARPGEPLLLQARPPAGASLTLRAEPPLAGAAFVATRRSWVPWSDADRLPGVDVTVEPGALAAGQPGSVAVEVVAPARRVVTVELPLPAQTAVQEDEILAANPGLDAMLVTVHPDRVILVTRAFEPATPQRFVVPVTPAFGGDFATAPVLVSVDREPPVAQRPPRYVVEGPPGS